MVINVSKYYFMIAKFTHINKVKKPDKIEGDPSIIKL